MNLKVQFTGLLQSPVSWARVSRELLTELAELKDIDLAIKPCRGWLWNKNIRLNKTLTDRLGEFSNPDLRLMFAFPPQLKNYHDDSIPLYNLSVYEATVLPENWVTALNHYCQKILVPSRHNLKLYKNSGINSEKLALIPYGFNPAFYSPLPAASTSRLKLLTLATPHFRKGLDLLLPSARLLKQSNISWKIHLPYSPRPGKSQFWEDSTIIQKLSHAGFELSTGQLSDQQVRELYQNCNLVVQPSRSEGFGLVILEAMASGRPVITADWGGHLDFSGPGMITVPGQLRPAKQCQYGSQRPGAMVFEPDQQALSETISRLISTPDRLTKLGRQALQTIKNWSWKRAAQKLSKQFQKITV